MTQNNLLPRFTHHQNLWFLRNDYHNYQPDFIVIDARAEQGGNNFTFSAKPDSITPILTADSNYKLVYLEGEQFIYQKNDSGFKLPYSVVKENWIKSELISGVFSFDYPEFLKLEILETNPDVDGQLLARLNSANNSLELEIKSYPKTEELLSVWQKTTQSLPANTLLRGGNFNKLSFMEVKLLEDPNTHLFLFEKNDRFYSLSVKPANPINQIIVSEILKSLE